MPEDYYSDASSTPGDASGAGESPHTEAGHDDQPTAVLPKSILAGKKFDVGDEVVLKIVAMHGDEVQVSYASEEDKGEYGPGESSEPAEAPSAMSSMLD